MEGGWQLKPKAMLLNTGLLGMLLEKKKKKR